MSEEIEILLAAKSFHETLEHLLEALDEEWISQSQDSMHPGGKLDLTSLSQSVFFEQSWLALEAGSNKCLHEREQISHALCRKSWEMVKCGANDQEKQGQNSGFSRLLY
ncbi:hypothetical protein C8R45DRAFT_928352 [Mycena sanguinolenta]|nr:hypothetical protein C8R45DRAFT_928352 [Mycena sanguinolenta]